MTTGFARLDHKSIVARTPTVAIEYDEKVRSMMQQVELEDQVVTIEDVREQRMLEETIDESKIVNERILERTRDNARKAIIDLI